MLELKRISDPQISPDGRTVAFTVQTVDVAANKKPQQIWMVPLEGGAPRQITRDGEANQRAALVAGFASTSPLFRTAAARRRSG